MSNSLENRMKKDYEDRNKYYLPRRTNAIIRIDGKNFSKYTKGLKDPYDEDMIRAMEETMKSLCKEIQGVKFGYTQSDEINLLLKDDDKPTTEAFYDNNIQKMASISASMTTAFFNHFMSMFSDHQELACFDARVFTIPQLVEFENYFIWINKDGIRNSINSYGRSVFSHKQLENKNTKEIIEMCSNENKEWEEEIEEYKYGSICYKKENLKDLDRKKWVVTPAFNFIHERDDFKQLLYSEITDNEIYHG